MSQTWIDFSKKEDADINLFCFPYSGGSAQIYQQLPGMLPSSINVFALELPGRGRRFTDELLCSLSSMVDYACAGIIPFFKNENFAFFGHSLGGLMAFELARELRRKGLPLPKHIFVSGSRAPQVPRREIVDHNLPFDGFVAKLRELGGTPEEILDHKEMLEIMVPILRKDFQAFETYMFNEDESLECPITAFSGTEDSHVTLDDIKQWSEHTNKFSYHVLEGGHFFLHTQMSVLIDIVVHEMDFLRKNWE